MNDALAEPDLRKVFVVHGRNDQLRRAMFEFLRAIGLNPIEWSVAVWMTGTGTPYIGDVLDVAFTQAKAVVVLLTPDEVAYLQAAYGSHPDDPDTQPAPQARPNVLFEAGMALGRHPRCTVLVEVGEMRAFSDIAGRACHSHDERHSETSGTRYPPCYDWLRREHGRYRLAHGW